MLEHSRGCAGERRDGRPQRADRGGAEPRLPRHAGPGPISTPRWKATTTKAGVVSLPARYQAGVPEPLQQRLLRGHKAGRGAVRTLEFVPRCRSRPATRRRVEIRVRDNGTGIPADIRDKSTTRSSPPSRPARAPGSACRSATTSSRRRTAATSLWTARWANTASSRYDCRATRKQSPLIGM